MVRADVVEELAMAKRASGLPRPLASGARRFEKWRRNRTTYRIPQELWSLAAALGARFGVSRTSRALGVQYCTLKKQINATAASKHDEAESSPTFLEILTGPSTATSEYMVEFESEAGAKMRIQVKGERSLDLAELCRLFVERRS